MAGNSAFLDKKGFTLIELLAVVGILGIMMALGTLVWTRTIPMVRLDTLMTTIQQNCSYARNGAISTGNDWFVDFDLDNHRYWVANDDGWKGTVTAKDQYDRFRDPRSYYLGNPDFDVSLRNNGILDDVNSNSMVDIGDYELVRGPFYLGKEMFFMKVNSASITRVTFDREGRPTFTWHSGPSTSSGQIWCATARFMQISRTDPGAGSTGEKRARKAVKIRMGATSLSSGMITVSENY